MKLQNKDQLKAFYNWQVLTAYTYTDLEDVLANSDIYRINEIQQVLLGRIVSLNKSISMIDQLDFDLKSLKEFEGELSQFKKVVLEFFEEENQLSHTLSIGSKTRYEQNYKNVAELCTLTFDEFRSGRIKISLATYHKTVSSLLEHFNSQNSDFYHVKGLQSLLQNAESWDQLSPLFSFPSYNIDDFNIKDIVVSTISAIKEIEQGERANLRDLWKDIGPQLIKSNNQTKSLFSNWPITSDRIVHTLQNIYQKTDRKLYDINVEQFKETKAKLLTNLYQILKFWQIDCYTKNSFCSQYIAGLSLEKEIIPLIPHFDDENIKKEISYLLGLITSFKNSVERLNSEQCVDFLEKFVELFTSLELREKEDLFSKEKKSYLLYYSFSLISHLKNNQVLIRDNALNTLFRLSLDYCHYNSLLAHQGVDSRE